MTFLSVCAHGLAMTRALHWRPVATLAGIAGVLPVVATVYPAEGLVTGFAPGWLKMYGLATLISHVALSVVAVTLIVNALIEFRDRGRADSPPGPAANEKIRAFTPSPLRRECSILCRDRSIRVSGCGRTIAARFRAFRRVAGAA